MASTPIAAANIANFIPVVYSNQIKKVVESNLVVLSHVNRQWEKELGIKKGDRVHVPNMISMTVNAVNTEQDVTLNDAITNKDVIIVNQWVECAVGFSDMHEIQAIGPTLDAFAERAGYQIAANVDSYIAALFASFTQAVGTEGSALTSDVILEAYEKLNAADAPASERVWIFDPESITDLMKIDMFVRSDYVPEGVMSKGFTGRQLLGAPVYISTNLPAVNTTYHAATYMHKEAIAGIMQSTPPVQKFHWDERSTTVVRASALYGALEMRDTFGVWIKTRS